MEANTNIINCNHSMKDKESNSNKQLSYKKDMWMHFDSIKDKFFFDRSKAKSLLYIISQKNDLEYEYSENLIYLYKQFIVQFDNNTNKTNVNDECDENTFNINIKNIINNLKYESELYANHSKDVLENVIKPLEGFIMNQCEIIHELIALMESYENEFKLVNHQLEQKQINFQHGGKSVETAINKLELIKNRIDNQNEDNFNSEENIFNLEDEDSQNEMIEKCTEMVEKNTLMAKQLQLEYSEFIVKAKEENILNYLNIYMNKYKL